MIFSNFRVDIQLFLNPRNFINFKFGFPACFYPKRGRFQAKITFLRLFASIYRPSLNQESVFSLRKYQIRIRRMFFPLQKSFPKKISRRWPPPLCSREEEALFGSIDEIIFLYFQQFLISRESNESCDTSLIWITFRLLSDQRFQLFGLLADFLESFFETFYKIFIRL